MSAARGLLSALTGAVLLAAATVPGWAQAGGAGTLLPGASSRDPVSIDSGRLDYFDKEQKLVYSGNVVAKQGDTTLKGSAITVFLSKGGAADGGTGSGLDAKQANRSVRRMEVAGPVTVVSKDEVGTGDTGVYDKAENKITLSGNVTLSQGTNVIKGDQLVYDMASGQAHVSGGRVRSVFTPGSNAPGLEGAKRPRRNAPGPKAKGSGTAPQAAE